MSFQDPRASRPRDGRSDGRDPLRQASRHAGAGGRPPSERDPRGNRPGDDESGGRDASRQARYYGAGRQGVPSERDPWESRPSGSPAGPRDARRQPRHRGGGGRRREPAPRSRRGWKISIAAVAAAGIVGAFMAAQKPQQAQAPTVAGSRGTSKPQHSAKPKGTHTSSADHVVPDIPAAVPTGRGLSGQVLGMGGLCLAGAAGGTSVVLATCTGSEFRQEWTQANGEFMLNGQCLGTGPGAQAKSPAGLYACNASAAQQWTVAGNQTIKNVGSGLCLGKDPNGSGVEVATCQPGSAAQTWIAATRAANPSGFALPVGNMPGWRQVFTDNFTENVPVGEFPAKVSNQWNDYKDGWLDTSHHGKYYPSKVVSIKSGIMNMYLHTENGIHMVAAPVPKIPASTGPGGGETYGIYEVRFRADPVVGYKTAWLLWPDNNSQAKGGEIDFPEANLQQNIKAFSHYPGPNSQKNQDAYVTNYTLAAWHTATIVWTAKQVLFLLDGKVVGRSTNPAAVPHTPMHWVLQTETRTGGGPPSNTAAGNVEIDWVSVWYEKGS